MHACLAHAILDDARIQAFQRPIARFRGGLVIEEEQSRLRHRRSGKTFDSHKPDAEYRRRITEASIYGGQVTKHFGHFMSEAIHRIIPSTLLGCCGPWVFVSAAQDRTYTSFEKLPGFAREVLAFLGVKASEFRVITENTIVDKLFVTEQGSELGFGPKPGYLADLHEYTTPRLDALHGNEPRFAKVYVSRRACIGNFLGEDYLEEQLKAEGFSVIRPETLPVSVQMDIYRKADVLVFNEGSACHGVELLGQDSLRSCYVLARRRWNSSFETILQPRARQFANSSGHSFIGSVFVDPRTGRPVMPWGVALFDARRLVSFFRNHTIARLPHFNEEHYMRAAEAHLHRYLENARASGKTLCDESVVGNMLLTFERATARGASGLDRRLGARDAS